MLEWETYTKTRSLVWNPIRFKTHKSEIRTQFLKEVEINNYSTKESSAPFKA